MEIIDKSEVARLRRHIADEYLAAKQGLTGLACGVPRHDFITARMEKLGQYQEQLNALLGEDQGISLLAETLADL